MTAQSQASSLVAALGHANVGLRRDLEALREEFRRLERQAAQTYVDAQKWRLVRDAHLKGMDPEALERRVAELSGAEAGGLRIFRG